MMIGFQETCSNRYNQMEMRKCATNTNTELMTLVDLCYLYNATMLKNNQAQNSKLR